MLNQTAQQKQVNTILQQEQSELLDIYALPTQQFVKYQKNIGQHYKSRGQKNKERIQKLQKRLHDPQIKKQNRKEKKAIERARIGQIIDKMPKQQAHNYLKKIQLQKFQGKQKLKNAMATGQMIIIDMVYEEKMNQKQNKSLGKQIQLLLKAMKLFQKPPSIHLCNFNGKTKNIFEKMSYQHLALTVHQEDLKVFAKTITKKMIYLSPDAEDCLDEIEQDQVFILGGLIDRTIIKNASLERAHSLGIQARKLPIRQYMKGRSCLNLDHVVSMLCKFKETKDWKIAFDYAAPKRWKKQSQDNLKPTKEIDQTSQNEDELIDSTDPNKQFQKKSQKQKKPLLQYKKSQQIKYEQYPHMQDKQRVN